MAPPVAGAVANFNPHHNPYKIAAPNEIFAPVFTVSGDKTPRFFAGAKFNVDGSTGNDGRYTVISSLFDSTNTVITVDAIPDGTVDGTINTHKILSDLTSGSLKAILKYSVYE